MIAEAVNLLTCTLSTDGLTGDTTLTVTVPRLGAKRRAGGRYAAKPEVTVYGVRVTPRFVWLEKRGGRGQLYTVDRQTHKCSCGDFEHRQREDGDCKHSAACRKVRLLQEQP